MATLTAAVRSDRKPQIKSTRILRVLAFSFFLIIYIGSAFTPALQDDVDSTHAEAAREMVVRSDYVTLHVNGVRYLEKAPLMYWAVAFMYRVFGVNDFATRLPTALAMFAIVFLAVRWGTHAFGERAGAYAGLFTATTAGCFLFTRVLIPEAILSALIAACMYFVATALTDRAAWRWYAAYACLALAVLTKGLLAIVVVGGTFFCYAIISGEWRRWREFRLATGLLLFVVIAAPWHLLAGMRNPGFFWFYFVNEHFLRFIGKRYPVDYNKLPGYLYWTLHLVWLFPWSLYLPVAIKRMWKDRSKGGTLDFAARTRLLCATWAVILLVFFAFSTNQEYYTFPAYFPILLLVAAAVARDEEHSNARWLSWCSGVLAAVCIAGSALLVAGLWSSRKLPFVADIGTVLANPNLDADTLSMGHILDLTDQSFAALRLPTIMAAVALAVGPLLAFLLRMRRKHLASTIVVASAMTVLLVAAHIALGRFDPYLSSKRLADVIAKEERPGDRVMIYGDQAFGSSLLFYLRQPIELVNGRTTSMWFGSTFADAPKIFLDDAQLRTAWHADRRVFLFVPPHEHTRVERALESGKYVIAESSGKVVYSNRP